MLPKIHASILYAIAIGYWANYLDGGSFIKLLYEKILRLKKHRKFVSFHIFFQWATFLSEWVFFFLFFFQTELQDESFDVITISFSSSVFVFTCIYQRRYRKKTFLSRNYEKRSKVLPWWLSCSIFFLADQAKKSNPKLSWRANIRRVWL